MSKIYKLQHPGVILSNILKRRYITISDFSAQMKMEKRKITAILDGSSDINPLFTYRLCQVIGGRAVLWMRLQKRYNLDQA